MSQTNIELGFEYMSESVMILQQKLETSFFDAYIENGENILDNGKVRVIDNVPSPVDVEKLEKLYQEISKLDLSKEDKRKITQLTLLKGLQEEPLQANHQLTPDSIGFLFVYIIEQLMKDKKESVVIGDLSVGMGNLLYTILANLSLAGFTSSGIGVDTDELLVQIAAIDKNWIDLDVSLIHKDSLSDLPIDPLDVVVGDLPIGFYTNDEQAKNFTTSVAEGHSYAHHLLMEQSMNYVTNDGVGLFLLPNNFLETEQAPALTKWLKESVYVQSILRLPTSLFSQESLGKSIVLLQHKGEHAKQAKEVLVAEIPSLKDSESVMNFVSQFRQWSEDNIF